MKKPFILAVIAVPAVLFARDMVLNSQTRPDETDKAIGVIRPAATSLNPQEIENLVSAVKRANPGDYIVLKSGKKYVLTKEEIEIARGDFDYDDLSNVKTETKKDGTQVKTISKAHVAFIYPDGQSTNILRTDVSFSSFMKFIEKKYHIISYRDYGDRLHDFLSIDSPGFKVFRASVQFQTISNGHEKLEFLIVTAYNYKGINYNAKNFMMKYCSKSDMVWGNISSMDAYSPTGETRRVEFDVE